MRFGLMSTKPSTGPFQNGQVIIVCYERTVIVEVDTFIYLGATLDKLFKFHEHIDRFEKNTIIKSRDLQENYQISERQHQKN